MSGEQESGLEERVHWKELPRGWVGQYRETSTGMLTRAARYQIDPNQEAPALEESPKFSTATTPVQVKSLATHDRRQEKHWPEAGADPGFHPRCASGIGGGEGEGREFPVTCAKKNMSFRIRRFRSVLKGSISAWRTISAKPRSK